MSTACGYSAPALMDKLRLWVGCCFCDKWTLAPLKKSCLSVSPPALVPLSWWLLRSLTLPLFVSFPSLHLARSLWLSEAQLCVVRDHILLTLLQEFWYISSLIDFLSSAVFFFFFIAHSLPFHRHRSSSQNQFHLSSHTNILTEFLLVRRGNRGARARK